MDFQSLLHEPPPEWLYVPVIALITTAIIRFLSGWLFKALIVRAKTTNNIWDDALLMSGQKPVHLFIWAAGISWTIDECWEGSAGALFTRFLTFRDFLFVLLFCWIFISFIKTMESHYLQLAGKKKFDQTSVIAMARLSIIAVVIAGVLIVMQSMGYKLSGLLAFGGVGGLALGFAAKDMLANFFGGWMIYLDKPFRVGDWISSPDKNIEGTVEYIGWRQTRILTFSRRPLYVPNSTFMSISVENPSRMQNRRIKQMFGLRYDDNTLINRILEDIRSYLADHKDVDQSKALMVNFVGFGGSSLDCSLYCFTRTTDWARYLLIQEMILLEILNIVHSHGGDIAFPTRTLDFPSNHPMNPSSMKMVKEVEENAF
ncbi:mechanosensitive ion channel family protein [uncultured Endozoicomonas sp.]|uniref:mechanosensitive ion channel family protein n=1 Tax=uncultured Endozoicomonas sp. TaxID=432652 RepID=UPI00260F1E15|nr:mechanosensitive ion channel family protein [uncultured Endozoicomonas sp.]